MDSPTGRNSGSMCWSSGYCHATELIDLMKCSLNEITEEIETQCKSLCEFCATGVKFTKFHTISCAGGEFLHEGNAIRSNRHCSCHPCKAVDIRRQYDRPRD